MTIVQSNTTTVDLQLEFWRHVFYTAGRELCESEPCWDWDLCSYDVEADEDAPRIQLFMEVTEEGRALVFTATLGAKERCDVLHCVATQKGASFKHDFDVPHTLSRKEVRELVVRKAAMRVLGKARALLSSRGGSTSSE